MSWIDLSVIFIFTLYLIIKETIPVISRKNVEDPGVMIFILAFFRFALYAMPLYVADIAFVPFIVNVLANHPFTYVHSFATDILRFIIVFGIFGLAKIIYPRIVTLNSKYNAPPAEYGSITDTIFVRLLSKTMNQSFLLMVIYVCILLSIVIPFGFYALLIQCPPTSSCWPL